VVFHGAMRVAEDDAADIAHLVCACEEPEAPRPLEHYQRALRERLDKDNVLAGLSDSDLMPPRASGVVANLGGSDMGRWIQGENLAEQNLRRGEERRFAEARARLEAQGLDPNEYGLSEMPPAPEAPPLDDLDALATHMESALTRLDDTQRQLEEKETEAREKARAAYAEMGMDYDEVMANAAKEGAGPPKFSAESHLAHLQAMAEESRTSGVPQTELQGRVSDPAFRAALAEQERGLREMYQRFGHLQPAASALGSEASQRVRIIVELTLLSGDSLANRDFTGADLAGMRLAGVDLAGALLEATDLSGGDLSTANLNNAMLARANLRGADLTGARLRGANLGEAVLEGALLDRADLSEAVLAGAKLTGARFDGAILTGSTWMETNLDAIDLSGADLAQGTFLKTSLRGARLVGSDLSAATFVECDLTGLDAARANLEKATFVTCKGEGVSFREARFRQGIVVHGSSFPRADLRDADLEKANLRGAALDGARFDRANLAGADLSEVDARGASFERAVLKGGLLIRTRLTGASLKGANLMDVLASKAHLVGANFTGANLVRADLSRTLGDATTTFAEAEVGHVRFLPKADMPPKGEP
jgi:uncharacterized protein YjbI with pentapeptide repeats